MTQKAFFLSAIFLILSGAAQAQDPTKVAPAAYKLEFENQWVKVIRVHYAPREKIPAHDHTEFGAAYVYLNDSGKVIFKHIGLAYGDITRPETKAGSFRLYKAVKEVHEVENPNDTPSDFMRVEFKTVPDSSKPLRGKFYREEYSSSENLEKVHFENDQIRATRIVCLKGKTCDVSANAGAPVLIVSLTPSQFESSGKDKRFSLEPGKTIWIAAGQKIEMKSQGQEPAELLRFDIKSTPVSPNEKAPNPHSH